MESDPRQTRREDGAAGSIADALFQNDKHVRGGFEFVHAPDKKGKVEVEIAI